MNLHKFITNKQGFTLIEILLVIGVTAIFASSSVIALNLIQARSEKKLIVNEVVTILRKAQSYSIYGRNQSKYGVRFDQDKYILFEGSSYNELDPNNIEYALPLQITFRNINLGEDSTIIFDRVTGNADYSGSVDFHVQTDPVDVRLNINIYGIISITEL